MHHAVAASVRPKNSDSFPLGFSIPFVVVGIVVGIVVAVYGARLPHNVGGLAAKPQEHRRLLQGGWTASKRDGTDTNTGRTAPCSRR
jgi:hypothetical protein